MKKLIFLFACEVLISGCAGVPQSHNVQSTPVKATLTIEQNYDMVWQEAMAVLTEVQTCEGCFFSITAADKSTGVISASSLREHQLAGQVNAHIVKNSEHKTTLDVMASISQYKYWGNLYGARFNERWENVDSGFSQKIAEQISLKATQGYGKSDSDVFLKVHFDSLKIRPGNYLTLTYHLYTRYDTTYLGFKRDLNVKNQFINRLIKRSGKENDLDSEKPSFGIAPVRDDSKKMVRIETVEENSPAFNVLMDDDLLKAVNDEKINDNVQLLGEVLSKQNLSSATKFSVIRGEKELDLYIVPALKFSNRSEATKFGFEPAYDSDKKKFYVRSISWDPNLAVGDVIEQVDGLSLDTPNDWRKIANVLEVDKKYAFIVTRDGKRMQLDIMPRPVKIHIVAEYLPLSPVVETKVSEIAGRKYVSSMIQEVRLHFDEPGEYVIEPGSVKVRTMMWGLKTTRILETEPLTVSVTK